MPIQVIPGKVCIKCNNNKWYFVPKTPNKLSCRHCRVELTRKWDKENPSKRKQHSIKHDIVRKENSKNFTDSYIKRLIYSSVYGGTKDKISGNNITAEEIEIYRESAKIRRINKIIIKNSGNMKAPEVVEAITNYKAEAQAIAKRAYQKKYTAYDKVLKSQLKEVELKELVNASVTGELTAKEKKALYNKEWYAKKHSTTSVITEAPVVPQTSFELVFKDLSELSKNKEQIIYHLDMLKSLLSHV
jgi:hypothetical protein